MTNAPARKALRRRLRAVSGCACSCKLPRPCRSAGWPLTLSCAAAAYGSWGRHARRTAWRSSAADRHEVIHADALHDEELAWAVRLAVHVMRGLRRQCAALTRHEPIDVARCPRLDHHRPLKTNEVVAVAAPSIVPIVQLSSAEAAHMSDPRAETAEPSCTVKSRPTGEPGEAMEATGA